MIECDTDAAISRLVARCSAVERQVRETMTEIHAHRAICTQAKIALQATERDLTGSLARLARAQDGLELCQQSAHQLAALAERSMRAIEAGDVVACETLATETRQLCADLRRDRAPRLRLVPPVDATPAAVAAGAA
jgi:hypothetical protein